MVKFKVNHALIAASISSADWSSTRGRAGQENFQHPGLIGNNPPAFVRTQPQTVCTAMDFDERNAGYMRFSDSEILKISSEFTYLGTAVRPIAEFGVVLGGDKHFCVFLSCLSAKDASRGVDNLNVVTDFFDCSSLNSPHRLEENRS